MISATGTRLSFEVARQSRLARAIADTQVTISTGKRIQRASDDPVAAARAGTLRRAQSDQAAWRSNVDLGIALTSQADTALRAVSDRLIRAQELAVAGVSGALPQDARNTIAAEIRGIADDIDELAATRTQLGEPLFSNGASRTMRFSAEASFAPVPSRDAVFAPGGQSISQQLRDMAAALESGDAAQYQTTPGIAGALVSNLSDAAAGVGTTASRLSRLLETNQSRGIDLAAERSALEDTDLTTAIASLNAQTLTLEAAQAAFARINGRTLFDILS